MAPVHCGHVIGADGKKYEAWLDYAHRPRTGLPGLTVRAWSQNSKGEPFPSSARLGSDLLHSEYEFIYLKKTSGGWIKHLEPGTNTWKAGKSFDGQIERSQCLKMHWQASNPDAISTLPQSITTSSTSSSDTTVPPKHRLVLKTKSTTGPKRPLAVEEHTSMLSPENASSSQELAIMEPQQPPKRQKTVDSQEIQVLREKAAKWDEMLATKSFAEIEELQASVLGFIESVESQHKEFQAYISEGIDALKWGSHIKQMDDICLMHNHLQSMKDSLQRMVIKPSFESYIQKLQDLGSSAVIIRMDQVRRFLLGIVLDGVDFQDLCKHEKLSVMKASHDGNIRKLDLNSLRGKSISTLQQTILVLEDAVEYAEPFIQRSPPREYKATGDTQMETLKHSTFKRLWEKASWTSNDLEKIKKHSERTIDSETYRRVVLVQTELIEPLKRLIKEMKDRKLVADEFVKNIEK